MGMKYPFAPFNLEPRDGGETILAGLQVQDKRRDLQWHGAIVDEHPSIRMESGPSLKDGAAPVKSRAELLKQLLEAISAYAGQFNFPRAQQLYDRLVMEFPTAISAIARAEAFIEQKRKTAMDPEKIRPWADLFNELSISEASIFYSFLKEFIARPNQPVFQQGSCDTRLYFIHSGQLKLKYFDYGQRKNITIKTLGRGDIAGIETFFTLTNHTTNLVAVLETKIYYLDKSDYQKILLQYPEFASKLLKFCESRQGRHNEKTPENMNRRAYQRYKTELKVIVHRLHENGQPAVECHEGKIVNISAGGLGYCVHHLKIGEAACLHNSRISLTATYTLYGLSHELKKTGKVTSLKFQPMEECSVHVQFDEPIAEERVIEIVQHADVIAYL